MSSISGVETGTPDELFRPLSPEQAALLELNPHPVLVLDAQFRIRFVNAASVAYGTSIGPPDWPECGIVTRTPRLALFARYEAVLLKGRPRRSKTAISARNAGNRFTPTLPTAG
jgi:hypothetical protein